MQSTHKIAGADARGYAEYLTHTSARGDYYLGGDAGEGEGSGGGAEGRWHGLPQALAALGLSAQRPVRRDQLLALMEGRSPASGEAIRRAGGDGSRVAGIDMTFSAPKSVSALWAASSPYRRAQIESAHHRAVASTIARVQRDVELVRTRLGGELRRDRAYSLVAAEFLHTASRLTRDQERGGVPDPQLHSHVVVLAAQRRDGRFAAVDSREIFRSARGNGAWYRAELAANLQQLGLRVQCRTGKDGRYFELSGVPRDLTERWSARSAQIEQAAREFRSRYGRDPRGGEISSITLSTRGTKTIAAQVDVDAAWRAVASEHDLGAERVQQLFDGREQLFSEQAKSFEQLPEDLLADITAKASMLSERDLQARSFELAAGVCRPERAKELITELERSGQLLRLEGGMWTTRELREAEQLTAERAQARADVRVAPVSERSLARATGRVQERIGAQLSDEQQAALLRITGPGGVVALEGQAGTGKGVVIAAAAEAWRQEGYTVVGAAVAGATAERLAADAELERSLTVDSLIARHRHGVLDLDRSAVLVVDEAGMADTKRLSALVQITQERGCKLLLVGDSSQLSPIGAGGMFEQIKERVPHARLAEVRRARHEWEREAWRQIREGHSERALASYAAHGQLHVSETREEAAERMVARWDRDRRAVGTERAVMLTDASNAELDRINALAQQARAANGELGELRVPLRERPYGLASGDRIIFTASHAQPGQRRIENGTIATVTHAGEDGRLQIAIAGPNPREVTVDTGELQAIKLAYAQHVYKAQGLTTERAQVLIGGWQSDRERAYVALTRAREATDIHITRADLGEQGLDEGAIERLAETIAASNAQQASISRAVDPRAARGLDTQRDAEMSNERDEAGAEPERARAPLSEVGRILAEQEARERCEAERDEGYGLEI
ncbi:MAG TPA: MobF family relaxase [Solirubrobacteraceae bacterium]|nr:MobF family relaxase [Solirubrobacteraceae bacterium]